MNNRNKIEDKIHSVHFSILDYHNIFITTFYQFQSVLQKNYSSAPRFTDCQISNAYVLRRIHFTLFAI